MIEKSNISRRDTNIAASDFNLQASDPVLSVTKGRDTIKTKVILFSVCLALILAIQACASYSFRFERTDDGSDPNIWTYTLYNDCTAPISLDSLGVYGSSAATLQAAAPDPDGWEYLEEDYMEWYPEYWQVIWESGMQNIPYNGDSVAGFSIVAPAGATAPTSFEVIYINFDLNDYESYFGEISQADIVPEPGSLLSLAASLSFTGLAVLRRRAY
ncbi:MAG: PEP-CTERM sorting domain-containing protein [Armatimonadetes bacterium]|nr:PEP-CTERM sorting domain-containing protein [Armatimonadota bacterium]